MQQAKEFWNGTAKKYARSPIADPEAYEYTMGRTRSYLTSDDIILEVGCGTGSTALLLATDVAQIVATDIADNMIEIASQKALDQGVSNVRFITAGIFDDAIDNGPYDVVLALNLLHLVEDANLAIQKINRFLKPGGMFISKTVCRPGRGASFKFRLIKAILPVMQFFGKAPYVNFMEIHELEAMVSSQGFKIIETGNHPLPSRFIVAQKT